MILLRPKLLVGVSVFALAALSTFGNEAYANCVVSAAAVSTQAGTAETVDTTACEVNATATPSTITFLNGGTGLLTLTGNAPSGTILNTTSGEGSIAIVGIVSSANTIGVGGGGTLLAVTVNDGVIFNLGHSLTSTTVTVGQGTSGILNQDAGTLTATTLTIAAGGTLTQSGTGVANATNVTIATGGTLTLANQNTAGTVTIDGAGAGQGALVFAGNYNTDAVIGVTSLASTTVNDGVTLTLDQNLSATTVTVGTGASGIVNQTAGTLTATTLAIDVGGAFTQTAGAIANATNITIANTGTVTLATQNSAGTVTIDGSGGAGNGALVFAASYNTDAAIGGGTSLASVTVNDGATLTLDQALSATTVTVGTGASGVVNQSAGTITATTLAIAAGGTLTQSGTGTIAASTTIATGGTLTIVGQNTGTIDGAGAGQGAVVFASDYNTDAIIGTTSLASLTVNDGATLTLDQNLSATTVTVGNAAGTGAINQSAGTLTATTLVVGAADTFTQSGTGVINGNATIATGGTLTLVNQNTAGTVTIDGAGAGQGALVFGGNYNTDAVLGGTNLASITVNDGVTLTLDQDASATTFNVGAGTSGVVTHSTGLLTATTLAIKSGAIFNQTGAGAITAATTIQDGGTMNVTTAFTHTGALVVGGGATGILDVGGVLLTETGAFTMTAGSTLKTTINTDAANDSGRIVASGNATIAAGTTIDITVTPGTLTVGQTFVIVTSAGGTIAVPSTITDNSASYNFTGSTNGTTTLTLTVVAASVAGNYTATTTSSNATAAATVFEAISNAGATGDMATVITAIDGLSGTARGDAIATTIPDTSGALTTTGLSMQSQSLGVVTSRLAALRGGLSGTSESGVSSGDAYSNSALWGQAFGASATQDRRKATDGYDAKTAGLAFGGDTLLNSGDWTVGGAYSYAVSNVNNKGSRIGNGSDINSHQGTAYASLDGGPYYVDILGSVARNTYDTTRQISVGAINRTARGDFNAMQYSAKVGGGYNFPMGNGWIATPTGSVQASRLSLDSYTETGASSLNLSVNSQTYNSVQTGLGMKGTYALDAGSNGEALTTSVHATWLYDVKSARQETTSSYTGGGASFITQAAAPARNAANLGAALNYDLGTGVSIAATYDAEVKDQYLGHSATATARMKF